MNTDTLPSVGVRTRLKQTAIAARAHLETLGPDAEVSTTCMAVALQVSRADIMASLVPAQSRGEVASREERGQLVWRMERRT